MVRRIKNERIEPDHEHYGSIHAAWIRAGQPRQQFDWSNEFYIALPDGDKLVFISVNPPDGFTDYMKSSFKGINGG